MSRIGVILAAGLGSRMKECLNDDLSVKPLASVDGLILLMRTIQSLEVADCSRIVVVLGYQARKIRAYVTCHYCGKAKLQFAINSRYHLQNGISVLCARPHVGSEFILTMADHILDAKIMSLVKNHRPPEGGATLCVDYKLETIFDIDDATKVMAEGDRLRRIGKNLLEYNCVDTGVFVATAGLMKVLEDIFVSKGDVSLSEGIQVLADRDRMTLLDIKDAFWQDVDNMDMLLHAEKLLQKASLRQSASV